MVFNLLRHVGVLLWKNLLLKMRRPWTVLLEWFIPPLSLLVLVVLRVVLFMPEEHCFMTFESDHLTIPFTTNYKIYYTPMTYEATEIVGIIQSLLNTSGGVMIGRNSESEIVGIIRNEDNLRSYGCFIDGAALIFNSLNDSTIEYTVRLRHETSESTWYTKFTLPLSLPNRPVLKFNPYLSEGFVHLENIVDKAIIKWKTGMEIDIPVSVRQFPYPAYSIDDFELVVNLVLPLVILMSFIYSLGLFVKELVLERESGMRKYLYIMGLSPPSLWISWYLSEFILLLLPVLLVSLLLKVGLIYGGSLYTSIFLYILLSIILILSFGFFLSACFTSTKTAMMCAFICYALSYVPYMFMAYRLRQVPLVIKIVSCILPATCIALGLNLIVNLEIQHSGLHWNTILTPFTVDDPLNIAIIIAMVTGDIILYFILSRIIEYLRMRYSCLTKWFDGLVCLFDLKQRENEIELTVSSPDTSQSSNEEEPQDIPAGIVVENITKVYKRRRQNKSIIAVSNVSINMYTGHITVLLGHNGAGKTTILSMITGLIEQTSGNIFINGLNTSDRASNTRCSVSTCPQHNVLFNQLTVREHLKLIGWIKGLSGDSLQNDIAKLIQGLQLDNQVNMQAGQLSGGMKRKLNIAMCLMGGPEVVVMDEPTSGMDPCAQLCTWNILSEYKNGRTLVLTTHSMQEADALGDRVVILTRGKVCCSGSSLYLKKKFGVGYHLTIVKEPSCDVDHVTNVISTLIRGVQRVSDTSSETTFILPFSSTSQFPSLFDYIEEHKRALNIVSYGISLTTLRDVFTQLMKEKSMTNTSSLSNNTQQHLNRCDGNRSFEMNKLKETIIHNHSSIVLATEFNNGYTLFYQQLYATLVKRRQHAMRYAPTFIWQYIIPLSLVLSGLTLGVVLPKVNVDDPLRTLTLDKSSPSHNITLFWAQRSNEILDSYWEGISPEEFGATHIYNITNDVNNIYDSIEYHSNLGKCCNYRYQILDKFCATRTQKELIYYGNCSTSEPVGFKHCPQCLNCCTARAVHTPSCTYPLNEEVLKSSDISNSDFCPSVPLTSISDLTTSSSFLFSGDSDGDIVSVLQGPLDSWNSYVAEHLLHFSEGSKVSSFSTRLLSGIVFHNRDTPYSTCNSIDTLETCSTISHVANTYSRLNTSIDMLIHCVCLEDVLADTIGNLTKSYDVCSQLYDFPCNGTASCQCEELPGDYEIDGLAVACLDQNSCQRSKDKSQLLLSASYPVKKPYIGVTIWYSNQVYHMLPAVLNAFYTAYLRRLANNSDITIKVNNHPLPRKIKSKVNSIQREYLGFSISFCVSFGISFLTASFVIFPVQERASKVLHLLYVSGIWPLPYWLGNYLWDQFTALLPISLTLIMFAVFHIPGYDGLNLLIICLLLVEVCLVGILLDYCFSYLISHPFNAFSIMETLYFCPAVLFQAIVYLVHENYPNLADVFHYAFLFHPIYSLSSGLSTLYNNHQLTAACLEDAKTLQACQILEVSYTENELQLLRPGVGLNLICLVVEAVVTLMMIVILEMKYGSTNCCTRNKKKTTNTSDDIMKVVLIEDTDQNPIDKTQNFAMTECTSSTNQEKKIDQLPVEAEILETGTLSSTDEIAVKGIQTTCLIDQVEVEVEVEETTSSADQVEVEGAIDKVEVTNSTNQVEMEEAIDQVEVEGAIDQVKVEGTMSSIDEFTIKRNSDQIQVEETTIFTEVMDETNISANQATVLEETVDQVEVEGTTDEEALLEEIIVSTVEGNTDVEENTNAEGNTDVEGTASLTEQERTEDDTLVEGATDEAGTTIFIEEKSTDKALVEEISTEVTLEPTMDGTSSSEGTMSSIDQITVEGAVSCSDQVIIEKTFNSSTTAKGRTITCTIPVTVEETTDDVTLEGTISSTISELSEGTSPQVTIERFRRFDQVTTKESSSSTTKHQCPIVIGKTSHPQEEPTIVVSDLVKIYKKTSPCGKIVAALNGISLEISRGECFGLLGVNGAGKTTTFKILTGEIKPTSGHAAICQYDLRTQLRQAQQQIGYCPQENALLGKLTGEEMIMLFARVRGVPEKQIKSTVSLALNRLGLQEHANKRCENYSGGTKRKLCTAVALVGDTPVLMLDEPTSGVDPVTRQFLWTTIVKLIQEGRSIIITSHSMEECEALCSHVAILVKGRIQCQGSIQELKNRYGNGYTLEVKISSLVTNEYVTINDSREISDVLLETVLIENENEGRDNNHDIIEVNEANETEILNFIEKNFPGSERLKSHQNGLTYWIPATPFNTWANIFREMEVHSKQLGISQYSINQTTLEQVFVKVVEECNL